ncbi:MAG: hypothetical protein HQL61_18265, partial [Magnetococcales bacterium]|nr:hypothetical protein [Nitrospirota bacterium]
GIPLLTDNTFAYVNIYGNGAMVMPVADVVAADGWAGMLQLPSICLHVAGNIGNAANADLRLPVLYTTGVIYAVVAYEGNTTLLYIAGKVESDYRVLSYRFNEETQNLEPYSLTPTLTVRDSGQNLVVQSGGGVGLCTLPNDYTYNAYISLNSELKPTQWGAVEYIFDDNRVIGSDMAYDLTAGKFTFAFGGRKKYTIDTDGNVTNMNFRLREKILYMGPYYYALNPFVIPSGTFSHWWIETKPVHKDIDGNYVASDYVMSHDIGNDALTGTAMKAGYMWKKQYPIAVISPTKALIRTIVNSVISDGSKKKNVTVNIKSRYYGAFDGGYLNVERNGVFGYFYQESVANIKEELSLGGDILESFSYIETRDDYPDLSISGYMCPIVATSGYCDGCQPIEAIWVISGGVPFTLRGQWGPAEIGGEYRKTAQGSKDIAVIAYDHTIEQDGIIDYVVIYQYTTYNNTETGKTLFGWTGTVTSGTTSVVTSTILTTSKTGKKILPQDTSNHSCIIEKGLILYTYCVLKSNKTFDHRIVGIINIDNKALSAGFAKEWTLKDDDDRLKDYDPLDKTIWQWFPHSHLAAIGIT